MKEGIANFSKVVNEESESYSIADDSISPYQKAAQELDLSEYPASPGRESPFKKGLVIRSPLAENYSSIGELVNQSQMTSERKLPFIVNS